MTRSESSSSSFTIGFLNARTRAKYNAWKHFGFRPNKELGKGENADNFDDEWEQKGKKGRKGVTSKSTSRKKCKDAQAIYRTILEPFRNTCKDGGVRCIFR